MAENGRYLIAYDIKGSPTYRRNLYNWLKRVEGNIQRFTRSVIVCDDLETLELVKSYVRRCGGEYVVFKVQEIIEQQW
jgi:hypothetical protein